jgi:hypothetical protein
MKALLVVAFVPTSHPILPITYAAPLTPRTGTALVFL